MNSGYPRINKKKRRTPLHLDQYWHLFPSNRICNNRVSTCSFHFFFFFYFGPSPTRSDIAMRSLGFHWLACFPLNAYADNRLCEPKQRVEILWCDFSAWWHVELHICKKIRIVNTNSWAKKNSVLYNIFRCTWGSIHLQYSLVWCCRWLETRVHMVCCTVLVVPLLRCFQKTNEKNT